MFTPLQGQVAWITGGGSGIGLAGAMGLAKAGAHVVISGRNAATNASALAALQAVGSAQALLLDVANKHAVKAAAQQILDRHGRIDILVNGPCRRLPSSANAWCRPRTWARPSCLWRKCQSAPASTNWSSPPL